MKFRAAPVVYRAICEGLVSGLQQAKAAGESATADHVVTITADEIMRKLNEILIFDQEEENLLTLQRIAEDIAVKQSTPPTNA